MRPILVPLALASGAFCSSGALLCMLRSMALSVGDKAPEFDVVASDGRRVKLTEYAGKKNVVLFFYPGDFTPVCTKESCGFQDMYKDLQGSDVEVIGVSRDDDESHKKFAASTERKYNDAIVFKRAQGRGRITRIVGLGAWMQECGPWVMEEKLLRPGTPRRNWKHTLLSDGWVQVRHPEWEEAHRMAFLAATNIKMYAE